MRGPTAGRCLVQRRRRDGRARATHRRGRVERLLPRSDLARRMGLILAVQ